MTLCSRASDMNRPGPKSCQGRHRTIRPRSLSLACFGMFAAPLPEGFAAAAHQSNHPWIACGVVVGYRLSGVAASLRLSTKSSTASAV